MREVAEVSSKMLGKIFELRGMCTYVPYGFEDGRESLGIIKCFKCSEDMWIMMVLSNENTGGSDLMF